MVGGFSFSAFGLAFLGGFMLAALLGWLRLLAGSRLRSLSPGYVALLQYVASFLVIVVLLFCATAFVRSIALLLFSEIHDEIIFLRRLHFLLEAAYVKELVAGFLLGFAVEALFWRNIGLRRPSGRIASLGAGFAGAIILLPALAATAPGLLQGVTVRGGGLEVAVAMARNPEQRQGPERVLGPHARPVGRDTEVRTTLADLDRVLDIAEDNGALRADRSRLRMTAANDEQYPSNWADDRQDPTNLIMRRLHQIVACLSNSPNSPEAMLALRPFVRNMRALADFHLSTGIESQYGDYERREFGRGLSGDISSDRLSEVLPANWCVVIENEVRFNAEHADAAFQATMDRLSYEPPYLFIATALFSDWILGAGEGLGLHEKLIHLRTNSNVYAIRILNIVIRALSRSSSDSVRNFFELRRVELYEYYLDRLENWFQEVGVYGDILHLPSAAEAAVLAGDFARALNFRVAPPEWCRTNNTGERQQIFVLLAHYKAVVGVATMARVHALDFGSDRVRYAPSLNHYLRLIRSINVPNECLENLRGANFAISSGLRDTWHELRDYSGETISMLRVTEIFVKSSLVQLLAYEATRRDVVLSADFRHALAGSWRPDRNAVLGSIRLIGGEVLSFLDALRWAAHAAVRDRPLAERIAVRTSLEPHYDVLTSIISSVTHGGR